MKKIATITFLCIITGFAGYLIGSSQKKIDSTTKEKKFELRQGGFKFINPLLECVSEEGFQSSEVVQMKHLTEKYIDSVKDDDSVFHISVYFRELNNGPWFGIGEQEKFSPASLLKVPILIAYLKEAESDPSLLLQKVTTKKIDTLSPLIPSSFQAEVGKSYTIDDLLLRMIAYSDNVAKDSLLGFISGAPLNKVYQDLSIEIPGIRTRDDYMSVKSYASFFRILYNASYLNRNMSEKALEFLSQVEFKEGIVAGVPRDVVVSHKFGERGTADSNTLQLHDCGIVYYPSNPYLLCVMTRGSDFEKLKEVIKTISATIYREIKKNK
ncbi:hypothetical protein COT62_01860 [Candidatus Roizmanbacteria bacterium CG09_land_8_20_14_0_10_41_9]|uniref:Beta-lactamase class A catalytic domain-containing protein n=1 Tax=Candidatus Roizmanbacteria bacterium CG09_land_8_20_14_0_10_41_9 TaxID=1974850 RepID=A0A2H0WSY0_9BACT|nr:MAG: hypothetical protein COT62_01860 [Candidatus Roizmanbacteria bacterium CG09_land_8_20_14_0_10_41_9]